MKNSKFLFPLLFLIITLYNVKTQTFELISIYPYCINGTAPIVFLEEHKEEYLYFGNNFYDSCTKGNEETKYYVFHSDVNIIKSNNLLNYATIQKEEGYYYIKIEEIENLDWKPINSMNIKPITNYNHYNWYYEIKKDEEKNVVLFRIAKNGNEKGSVSMYTLSDKPNIVEENEEEKNNEKNDEEFIIPNSNNYLSKFNYVFLALLALF